MLTQIAAVRDAFSAWPFRIVFGFGLLLDLAAIIYCARNWKRLFGHHSGDLATDSPASGNLRLWMVFLILGHAAVLLTIMIFEV